jgi:cobalt-zinc-cadmium efflux system outer membrane protein
MNTDRNRTAPLARASTLAACLAAIGGCASLDPAQDYRRAGGMVEERSGAPVDWTSPWSEAFEGWDGALPLTQDAAVKMALRNNRELRAEVERIAESRADLVQAGLLPNPVLSLTLRAPVDPADGVWFVGAAAVQQLTALWLRDGKIRAADARLNETVLDVSDSALRLVADVRATHARIAFGQRELDLTREAETLVRESIDAMRRRVIGGEATPLDTARLEQQLVSFETDEADLSRALAKERRRLLELMGFPAADADWAASDADLVRALPADEATAIALARSQRLDVAASRALAEASAADLSVEERNRLREFGVGVDFERDTDESYTLGPVVEAEIPIFDTNEAQIAKAGSTARAALATSEAVAHRAIREARAAYIEATEAATLAARLRDVAVPLGERVADLAQRGVTAGVSDTTVLLEARRDLLEVRRTLTRREADAAVAAIELEYAVGGTVAATSGSSGTPQKVERP